MTSKAPRVDAGAILVALPEAIALALLAALPAFINLVSERIFEEEKALLIRAGALLALPGVILAWRRRGAPLLRHTVVLAFGALTATLLVAAIAATAPHDAWFGAYLRRHGIFTWLALAVVFAAMCTTAGTPAGRDRLLGATVLGSIWPSCYALLQRVGVDPVSWIAASTERAGSTFGNPIFVLAELDRPDEAIATLSRLLQIEPADPVSLELRDRLSGRDPVSGQPRR